MTIATAEFTTTPEAARRAFLEYKQAVEAGSDDPGDKTLVKSYRAICKGKRLIDLNETMRLAGLNDDGSPKLAIVRADAKLCWAAWSYSHRRMHFGATEQSVRDWGRGRRVRITIEPQSLPLPTGKYWDGHGWRIRRDWSGRAVVPTIPPRFRPKHHLRNYHILWEADWERVPIDPILLKRIDGPIYAVMAQWDLTPLERTVLGHRLREDGVLL
jgi:hypothetical protein